MRKKIYVFILLTGFGAFIGLQSCSINNSNPTVPAPIPTNTASFTPTNTPTSTPTATLTLTPVVCATHVVLSVASGATTSIGADYTYVDQFTFAPNSNFNAVTVAITGAGASGTGNNLQVALYSDSANYPVSVLFTSGSHQITSTAGPTTYVFNPTTFSLPAGTYWLGLHSSVQYQPNQDTSNSALNFTVSGHFPDPFPTPGGASAAGAPWSYSLDTCHP